MPKLKQPDFLKDTSMKFLVIFFADYFHKRSTEGSLLKIRQCVAFIKEDICPEMSWKLEAEFCYRLIKEFLWFCNEPIERPKPHIRAVAEVIMDRKIIGLKCTYRVLDFLEPDDTRRILGLKELDLGPEVTHILENFHLEDITEFVYGWNCTDSDLQLIGQNCRKLLYLDVRWSEKVADVRLRALRGCPDLQFVYAAACSVSESGVIELLSANRSIRQFDELRIWVWDSLLGSSVYPSIDSLGVPEYSCSNGSWRSVSERFPNLKSLGMVCNSAELLEELKYSRLSQLTLDGWCEHDALFLLEQIDHIFRLIGANLLSLTLMRLDAKQRTVDSVFHFCSNLENSTSLGNSGLLMGDLALLKPLRQLAKLDFSSATGFSWNDLKKLLPSIGVNLTDLRTNCPARSPACISQSDLNLLFDICPNLELLQIHYQAYSRGEKLIIPPFKKLKELDCSIPRRLHRRRAVLDFGEMLELEDLLIDRFYMTAETVKSMILDSATFPKLKLLKISEITVLLSICLLCHVRCLLYYSRYYIYSKNITELLYQKLKVNLLNHLGSRIIHTFQ